jgi:hypothetical protein
VRLGMANEYLFVSFEEGGSYYVMAGQKCVK